MVRRQQWVCRTLFVLFGLLPLAIVCAAQLHRKGTASAEIFRLATQARIGMGVQLEDVEFPRPGVARLRGLTLMHSETAAQALFCETIVRSTVADETLFEINRATIQSANWKTLRASLFDRLLKQPKLYTGPVRVVIRRLEFTSGLLARDATDVQIRLWKSEQAMRVHLKFRWEGQPESDYVELDLERYSPTAAVPTRINLRTGKVPIPCDVVVGPEHDPERLLADVSFDGNLWLKPVETGWQAHFHGTLAPVDLQAWVGKPFGTTLSGKAVVTVEKADVINGELDNLIAIVRSDKGEVAGPLLFSAQKHLRWQLTAPTEVPAPGGTWDPAPTDWANRTAPWQYEDLALQVNLKNSELAMFGKSRNAIGPVMYLPKDGVVTVETPAGEALPPSALLHAVLPDDADTVPVSDMSKPLLFFLPIGK